MTNVLNKPASVDVLISGGGAAGYSLALALNNSQSRTFAVALVETHNPASGKSSPGFDARLIALSAQSLEYFDRHSVGQQVRALCTPIEHIHVSEQGKIAQCELHATQMRKAQLGGVIALEALGELLQSHVKGQCLVFQPDSIAQVTQKQDCVEVTLASGKELSTRLLVIAEGANSQTAGLLGTMVQKEDYQQSAIVANVQLQHPHKNWAFERFTGQGPMALLPMSDNCMSLVWCAHRDTTEVLMSLSEGYFLSALQEHFGMRLGHFVALSKRFSYPLALSKNHDEYMHRAVTVANSAQTLHPIAGQGFNLGLRDIQQLQHCLSLADDPGCYSVLRSFQQLRKQDRAHTMAMTDGMVRLFSNQNPALSLLRNIGLMKMSMMPGLLHQFGKKAMGYNMAQFGSVDCEKGAV